MANEGDVDGGHRLGNFPNYYKFHPVEQRLKLFPPNFFVALFQALGSPRALFLLDVGCNEGDLSIALYHHVKRELGTSTTVRILGTDIDTTLVNRAVEKSKDIAADVSFIAMDYMEEQTSKYKLMNTFGCMVLHTSISYLYFQLQCGYISIMGLKG